MLSGVLLRLRNACERTKGIRCLGSIMRLHNKVDLKSNKLCSLTAGGKAC